MKWVRKGSVTVRISPDMALCIARGGTYEGTGTNRRVRIIREVITRKLLPFVPCYRTTESATLPPSVEYLNRTRGGGKRAA